MSVDRTDYLMIGYKMPYDVKFKDGRSLSQDIWDTGEYLPMVEGWKDEIFSLIPDGMSGNYICFGIVLVRSDIYAGFDFTTIDRKGVGSTIDLVYERRIIYLMI